MENVLVQNQEQSDEKMPALTHGGSAKNQGNQTQVPDLIVVGSGFFGATISNLAAQQLGAKVLLIEKRDHVGGNSYSYRDPETNIEVHKYGTHLFHTSNKRVWDFITQFTEFNSYRHHVWSVCGDQVISMPINLDTICQVFGKSMTPKEAKEAIDADIAASGSCTSEADNLEQKAISLVGPKLYKSLIEGYTRKQWQTDPRDLPSEIITRLPVRFDFNNRYFSDAYEGLPVDGYGALFNKMLDHPNIRIETSTDYFETEWSSSKSMPTVYTGPLDRYFNFSHGSLSWRTLDFEWEWRSVPDAQGCSVMNYADLSVPFTRIHEFRHLHPEREMSDTKTLIAKEYSRWAEGADEPYYPVNGLADREKLEKYRALASLEENVIFGGRLGTYQYLDMHMSIASAISAFENKLLPLLQHN